MTQPGKASVLVAQKVLGKTDLAGPKVVAGLKASGAGLKAVAIVTRVIYNGNIIKVIVYLAPLGATCPKSVLGNISRWLSERF
jgi:hypothetical protein